MSSFGITEISLSTYLKVFFFFYKFINELTNHTCSQRTELSLSWRCDVCGSTHINKKKKINYFLVRLRNDFDRRKVNGIQ
jgi:hypothetical protein